MDYRKKYELQKSINANLIKRNKELEQEIAALKQELDFTTTCNMASADEAKKLIMEIASIRDEMKSRFDELDTIKGKYTEAYNQAVDVKRAYARRFKNFQKTLK